MIKYPHLFSPITIRGVTFKNRIASAPLATCDRLVNHGVPTDECIAAYESRALGGAAQVTVTETAVDFELASRHNHGFDIVSEDMDNYHMEAIGMVVEGIRAHGAVASIQIAHVGNLNHPYFTGGKNPIGPSAFIRDDGVAVDEMDEAMMDEVAAHFAHAAAQAKRFGFDMVMVHGGHGWLFSQFLSPMQNHRTDEYGGSIENRSRFALKVLSAIRRAVGEDFLIEYRISAEEGIAGGAQLDDTIAFLKLAREYIDLVNVSTGTYHLPVQTETFTSIYQPHAVNAERAAAIRREVGIPVSVVGGINDVELAESLIAEGKADFVALGRQMFADPEFALKAMTGREDEIFPCLRCSCFNPLPSDPSVRLTPAPFRCAVNPMTGRELRMQCYPKPRGERTVLVVGGGCAGLFAAVTARERGHRVILAESSDRLGGILNFAQHDHYKGDIFRFLKALLRRFERSGAELRLNTRVTREYIEELAPDAVICAVGSSPVMPDITGLREHSVTALSAYDNAAAVGKRVVVMGGGPAGCELALSLAAEGREVTVLELSDELASDALESHKLAIYPLLERDVTALCGMRCTAVSAEGVTAVGTDGSEALFSADTVINALGMRANAETVSELSGATASFRAVGDCKKARKITDAMHEAFFAAMDIR